MTVMSGEISVTLQRDGTREPFGFRLRGGSDIREAFIIQRVSVGSPAEGELRRGDVVTQINGHPTSEMSHREGADMIKNAGTKISLVVQRAGPNSFPPAFQRAPLPAVAPAAPAAPDASDELHHVVSTVSGKPAAHNFTEIMQSPVDNLPATVFPSAALASLHPGVKLPEDMDRNRERIIVTHQPYRTTPLVLPGAKVGRDTATTTQSYLALQTTHNPMLWHAPGTAPVAQPAGANDVVIKQKLEAAAAIVQKKMAAASAPATQVAITHEASDGPPQPQHKQELVHRQFNSPLGLYSNESVQEVVAQQSGLIPPNPARYLDLKNSETLRVLMEEDDGQSQKAVRRDSRGLREARPAAPGKAVPCNPQFKVNVGSGEKEKIAQSYSFKRLMADVLGETDF